MLTLTVYFVIPNGFADQAAWDHDSVPVMMMIAQLLIDVCVHCICMYTYIYIYDIYIYKIYIYIYTHILYVSMYIDI